MLNLINIIVQFKSRGCNYLYEKNLTNVIHFYNKKKYI